jgi:hypothetical protein
MMDLAVDILYIPIIFVNMKGEVLMEAYSDTTYLGAYEAFEPLYAAMEEARIIAKAEAKDPEAVKAAMKKHDAILMLLIRAKELVEDQLYNM